MNTLDNIKTCRSVRKYTSQQISLEDLNSIIDAGIHSANAGGAQRSMVVAIHDVELATRVGRMNMAGFSRENLAGNFVSSEQPSVIDDPTIKNGFYDAPTALCVFCQKDFAFSIADAFAMVQSMALEAHELGLASCIISRAETTFASLEGQTLLREWNVPESFICRAFLAVGYCDGPYPAAKPRREGRVAIVTSSGVQECR